MIFVTVGTHEQQFDRLVKAVDDLRAEGALSEPVFIQTGYCEYAPEHCEHERFLSFEDMAWRMRDADVVITHGGPSSFIEAMAAGKVPVVVPRKGSLGEHVNDHQADFVHQVAERKGGIVPCYEVADLPSSIEKAREAGKGVTFRSHNAEFCEGLGRIIRTL